MQVRLFRLELYYASTVNVLNSIFVEILHLLKLVRGKKDVNTWRGPNNILFFSTYIKQAVEYFGNSQCDME